MADNVMARKQGGWKIVSMVPDVCKTPMGSSVVPVPYPVTSELVTASDVATSVKLNGFPLIVYGKSFTPMTNGDQAGSATGIKSGTVGGKCVPELKSSTVKAEGSWVVRHDDLFWMNGS